ncbi:efflux RND transporter periplasmic adaptor subunit [Kamptonema cortianum]|nr:efflux RND transporter periplasmic adaptor subunit [Geitlerinema splendidum]MDK3162157.1 efflux RND transporter periplasmic adaptor subunit [Kamptonema cortianum]
MKKTLIASAIVVSAFALPGCVNRAAQEQAKETAKIVTDQTQVVTAVAAEERDVPHSLSVTGSIVTDEDVAISAKQAGRLTAVYVRDGSVVKAGQVIAQQESSEAMARLKQARANADAARAAVRQAKLEAETAPSRSDAAVKASEARVRQAKAALDKALNGSRAEEKAQAKANLDRAKSDLDLAKKTLERSKRLFEEGAIAKAQLEADQNRSDNAQAAYNSALEQYNLILDAVRPEDIEQAREALKQAEQQLKIDQSNKRLDANLSDRVRSAQAQLDSALEGVALAQTALADLTIRAPMSGKVSGKPAQPGAFMTPGAPICRLINTGGVYMEADVPEKDVVTIQPGMPVAVYVDALGATAFSGQVAAIDPLASNLGRLYKVRISFQTSNAQLKPGMFARGELNLGTDRSVMTVPSASIQRDGESASIYTVAKSTEGGDSELIAKKVSVKIVRSFNGLTIVEGVSPGDQVIVKGATKLVDGAAIRLADESEVTGETEEEGA